MRKDYIENLLASCESSLDLALRDCVIPSPKWDLINSVKETLGLLIVAIDSNTIEN